MKRIFKALSAVMLVFLLILASADSVVFATAGNGNDAESAENVADETATEENVVAEPAVEAEPAAASEKLAARQLLGASVSSIVLDGKNTATTDEYVFDGYADLYSTSRTMSVQAVFPDESDVTGRQVSIRFNNILSIKNAPGMVADADNIWAFDASTLPAQLKNYVLNAVFTPDAKVLGNFPGTGTLTYEIDNSAQAVLLEISVGMNVNYGIMSGTGQVAQSNVVESKVSYTKAGTLNTVTIPSVKKVTLKDGTGAGPYFLSLDGQDYKAPGDTGQFVITLSGYIYSANYGAYPLYKELKFTYQFPKAVGITDTASLIGGTSAGGFSMTVDRTSSTEYDYATFTMKDFKMGFKSYIGLNYQVKADAADATYGLFEFKQQTPEFSFTGIDGVAHTTTKVVAHFPRSLIISTIQSPVLSTQASGTGIAFHEPASDFNYLGSYNFYNQTAKPISDQAVKLDFSEAAGVVGVQGIAVSKPAGVTIGKVRIVTTTGAVYTLDEPRAVSGTRFSIDLALIGVTNPNEYLKEVSWEMSGEFPAGWVGDALALSDGATAAYYNAKSIRYYGKVLQPDVGTEYVSNMRVTQIGKTFNEPGYAESEQTMTIKDAKYVTLEATSNISSYHLSGTSFQASATVGISSYGYFTDAVLRLKGLNVYLREGDYLTINPESITVEWNGTTYGANDGFFTVTQGTDNQGKIYYTVNAPKAVLDGIASTDLVSTKNLKVNYDVRITSAAPTTSILASDLISATPIDSNISENSMGYANIYNAANTFDVTKSGDVNQRMGAPTGSLNITAQKDFVVTTAVSSNGGSWTSYDYDEGKTIVDLSPDGTANYKLTVANRLTQPVNGYVALIPIPKYNESTSLMPANPDDFDPATHLQKEKFTWTASLLEEVSADASLLNYQILYSTSYETNKDSANFVAWSAIGNKNDIRMVKISTVDTIAAETLDEITFPLTVTDTAAEAHSDNVNIYSARIYRDIDGTAGYKASEPVAIRLKTGIVNGIVFNDTNRNGKLDNGETGRNGVTVIAYAKGTNTVLANTTSQKLNNVDGSYQFLSLDKTQNVDIVFINPNTDDSTRFAPVTSGGSRAVAEAGHLQARVSNITPSSTDAKGIYAGLITPVTITYDAQGGTATETEAKRYPGEMITTAPDASKGGHRFLGWYSAASEGTKIAFPYTAGTSDVTLYAQYELIKYTVTFDVATNGGQGVAPAAQTLAPGAFIEQPADAVKAGYNFLGWFDTATGGTAWNFGTDTMTEYNMTLYAQFEAADQTITFDVNGGDAESKPDDIVAPTDSTVNLDTVAAPTWFGHEFLGWKTASGTAYSGTFTMPAGGLTLIAQWRNLIDDGTWQITADDVIMPLAEYNQLVADKKAEAEVLRRSNAKAWHTESLEALNPIYVDLSNVKNVVGTYTVEVSHRQDESGSMNASGTGTSEKLATTMNLTLTADDAPEALPATGQNHLEAAGVGFAAVLISGTLLYKRRKNK